MVRVGHYQDQSQSLTWGLAGVQVSCSQSLEGILEGLPSRIGHSSENCMTSVRGVGMLPGQGGLLAEGGQERGRGAER